MNALSNNTAVVSVLTETAEGAALDYAVAMATNELADQGGQVHLVGGQLRLIEDGCDLPYEPSQNWAQIGPYINQFDITVRRELLDPEDIHWRAVICGNRHIEMTGDTPQIAVARLVVAFCLGNYLRLPAKLCTNLT